MALYVLGGVNTVEQCTGGAVVGPYQQWQCWPYFNVPITSNGYYEGDAYENPITTVQLYCGRFYTPYIGSAVCTAYKSGLLHWKAMSHTCCSGCTVVNYSGPG